MRGFGVFGAVVALVVVCAAGNAYAQTAATEPVGRPLALLAGLRPPHEHKKTSHAVYGRATAGTSKKTAAKTHRVKAAVAHARHASARKLANRKYRHHERAVTASAFAEEPPVQPAPNPASAAVRALENSAPGDAAAMAVTPLAPAPESAPPNADASAEPAAAKIQTVKIVPPNPRALSDPAGGNTAASATAPGDQSAAAAPAQIVLATPPQEQKSKNADPVGSASWIAQVLAAFGGAVTAGAVAWFLIGGGPVRTYG